jgi:hypothetical protein
MHPNSGIFIPLEIGTAYAGRYFYKRKLPVFIAL